MSDEHNAKLKAAMFNNMTPEEIFQLGQSWANSKQIVHSLRGQGSRLPQPKFNPYLAAVKSAMLRYGLESWFEVDDWQVDFIELGVLDFNAETLDTICLETEMEKGNDPLLSVQSDYPTGRIRFVRKF